MLFTQSEVRLIVNKTGLEARLKPAERGRTVIPTHLLKQGARKSRLKTG
jgi:hypothetical protein